MQMKALVELVQAAGLAPQDEILDEHDIKRSLMML
jgi:hypothetical protein